MWNLSKERFSFATQYSIDWATATTASTTTITAIATTVATISTTNTTITGPSKSHMKAINGSVLS